MRGLNFDWLHAFAQVIELGTFSAAAERLGVTQPAISLQIRQLESRLGVRLVERVGRRATPTAAGEALLEHARRIDAAVAALDVDMAQYSTGMVGRVRLGTGATACIYLLPPILRALRQRFERLDVTVRTGNTRDIVKAIEDNAIDVGLVTLPVSHRALDVTPLWHDELVAIAPKEGPALPQRVTAGTLATRPLVLYEAGGHTRDLVDDWFARQGMTLAPVMSLGSVEAIKELVAAGLGTAVLPAMAVTSDSARKGLDVRPLQPRLSRTLGLVMRRDKPLHAGLRAVIDALKEAAGRKSH
ncbi:LysR family transcriptional regulator [Pandoraea terrae]|uniref:LysR family transcriptional regulator n=1 Tax=Pandoraea terrae TaxID=1537710 RepID=A0A5E4TCL6_9BURK|nr:LysR family transcriptional regulator [Pandoraea terrae]VVD85936.1 LysR family transcriptional regulator [Pandoraea terrae]